MQHTCCVQRTRRLLHELPLPPRGLTVSRTALHATPLTCRQHGQYGSGTLDLATGTLSDPEVDSKPISALIAVRTADLAVSAGVQCWAGTVLARDCLALLRSARRQAQQQANPSPTCQPLPLPAMLLCRPTCGCCCSAGACSSLWASPLPGR